MAAGVAGVDGVLLGVVVTGEGVAAATGAVALAGAADTELAGVLIEGKSNTTLIYQLPGCPGGPCPAPFFCPACA